MLCPHLLLILIMLGLIDRNHTCLDAKAGGGGGEGLGGFGPHGGPFPGSLPSSAAPEGSVE